MTDYDVIIVGARCAGSPLAMLLAREGLKVIALDRDAFPCDTLSTAYMQQGAVRRLNEWGLYERFLATAPAAPAVQRNFWEGMEVDPYPAPEGSAHFSPRRAILDNLLAQAACEAGAEVRTGVSVLGLIRDGSGRVTGVRTRSEATGEEIALTARLVVGADGRNSLVAKETGAGRYHIVEGRSCTYYSYYRGLPAEDMQVHFGPDHVVYSMPTHNGEVCLALESPSANFPQVREDPRAYVEAAVREYAAELAPALEHAENTSKWFGMAPRESFYRVPWGPGWALIGDAGYLKDPVLGTGIDDAFRDAAMLAAAISPALRGEGSLDLALAGFHTERDELTKPLYDLVCEFARMEGVTEDMLVRAAECEL